MEQEKQKKTQSRVRRMAQKNQEKVLASVEISDDDEAEAELEEEDEQLRTLFVANLDESVTEKLLYELFLQAGPIEEVRIPKDNTGKQRTFGFVVYSHRCSPPYALQLYSGLRLFRRTLAIKFQNQTAMDFANREGRGGFNAGSGRDGKNVLDNSALRAPAHAPFMDPQPLMPAVNPFRLELPVPTNDWTRGSSRDRPRGRDRHLVDRHVRSRFDDKPYDRRRSRFDDGHSSKHVNDQVRRHHHSTGSNRHSDQRSHHRGH